MNISKNAKLTKVKVATVGGTAAINSDSIDMEGFEGVLFFVTVLAITAAAVTSINAAQSGDDSSFDDLKDSKIVIADDDDDETFVLDIYRPTDRYLRLEVARATQNSAFGEIYALQYGARKNVTQNVAGKVTAELHVGPDEGTA